MKILAIDKDSSVSKEYHDKTIGYLMELQQGIIRWN